MATYRKTLKLSKPTDPVKEEVERLRDKNRRFYQNPSGFNLNALPNNTGKTYSQAGLFIRHILNDKGNISLTSFSHRHNENTILKELANRGYEEKVGNFTNLQSYRAGKCQTISRLYIDESGNKIELDALEGEDYALRKQIEKAEAYKFPSGYIHDKIAKCTKECPYSTQWKEARENRYRVVQSIQMFLTRKEASGEFHKIFFDEADGSLGDGDPIQTSWLNRLKSTFNVNWKILPVEVSLDGFNLKRHILVFQKNELFENLVEDTVRKIKERYETTGELTAESEESSIIQLAEVYDNAVLLFGRYKKRGNKIENRRFVTPSQLLKALILIFKAKSNFETFTVSYARAYKNRIVKLQLTFIEEVISTLCREGVLEITPALDTFLYDPFKDSYGFFIKEPEKIPTTTFSFVNVANSLSKTKLDDRKDEWINTAVLPINAALHYFKPKNKGERTLLITYKDMVPKFDKRFSRRGVEVKPFSNEMAGNNPDPRVKLILIVGDFVSAEMTNLFQYITYDKVKLSDYVSSKNENGGMVGFYVRGPEVVFRFIMNAVISDLKEYINLSRRVPDRKVIVISGAFTAVRYKDNQRLAILEEIFEEFGLKKIPLAIK